MNSRQWLRRREFESPGRKKMGFGNKPFDEQGSQQFAFYPGPRGIVVALGNVSKPKERLEALEAQLDLPASAVEIKNIVGIDHVA